MPEPACNADGTSVWMPLRRPGAVPVQLPSARATAASPCSARSRAAVRLTEKEGCSRPRASSASSRFNATAGSCRAALMIPVMECELSPPTASLRPPPCHRKKARARLTSRAIRIAPISSVYRRESSARPSVPPGFLGNQQSGGQRSCETSSEITSLGVGMRHEIADVRGRKGDPARGWNTRGDSPPEAEDCGVNSAGRRCQRTRRSR